MADYAYFIENTDSDNFRDNSKVFKLIQDLNIQEEDVFIDTGLDKNELEKLIDVINRGDRLIISTVKDLADDAKQLSDILQVLQDRKVVLCSCSENFLNGNDYHMSLRGFVDLHKYYLKKKQEIGFEKAKKEGTVGRPKQTEAIEKALRLYDTKAFSIDEIEKLSGISSSTIYRYLKDRPAMNAK